jgi:hypothetical protein
MTEDEARKTVRSDIATIERAAFDRGVRAAREAAARVVHDWWSKAPAGHRHPGHPHHLEVAIRKLKPEWVEEQP